MIGKSLYCSAVLVGSLLGLAASAVATSKNVDATVARGAALTTFTFVNNTGSTLPAGTPVSMGQAFRYGDIMPGTYPVIRDAATHIALRGQQWDEVSSWRENGGNGSWRHAVWAIWLPKNLAGGASYTFEFVLARGVYSQSSHQPLGALCKGPGAHDLKIHLTDVRNQDDTVRDSGDATFRLCDNVANVGRDAPRHLRAGNVYDEYEVHGLFTYGASGHRDPLLYASCIVDLFTRAADGISPDDVRWVCHIHNSWMNVAAGSAGNPGAPGPAGFVGDPQAISYRPEILDGPVSVLNWSGLDATVSSASNPVRTTGCGTDVEGTVLNCINIPSSIGANAWYYAQGTRVSCTGTCLGGLTNGSLYWVYNNGSTNNNGGSTNLVTIENTPQPTQKNKVLTGSQGSGTTSFSFRIWHPHWEAWQTLDASGDENWSLARGTRRVTRRVFPAFTASEQRYWEETGLVLPVDLNQKPAIALQWGFGGDLNYRPFGRFNVIGGTGAGGRPDLGLVNEYAVQAFIKEDQASWLLARLFTQGSTWHGFSTLLDERTGRIPALNNGPPTGPGGSSSGTAYPELGAPQNQVTWHAKVVSGLTLPPSDVPNANVDWSSGVWPNQGTAIDHMPAFDGYTYLVFGSRYFLDMMHFNGNRDYLQQIPGPGDGCRDNVLDGIHFWGLSVNCCEIRGAAWSMRDRVFPAALGADGNVERSYFNDFITETGNYWPHFLSYKDGPGSTAYSTSIIAPNNTGGGYVIDTFITNYVFLLSYQMQTYLHAPLAAKWLSKLQQFTEGVCGEQMPGHPVSYYCIDYTYSAAVHDGDHQVTGANVGQWINGTDASDFGSWSVDTNYLGAGKWQQASPNYTLTAGDKVKFLNGTYYGNYLVDQLPGKQWFTVTGPIDNAAGTFYVQCPPGYPTPGDAYCPQPGQAFVGYSRGGVFLNAERPTSLSIDRFTTRAPGKGLRRTPTPLTGARSSMG
jgi:hypothetical protein